MAAGELVPEGQPPVPGDARERAVGYLQGLLATGRVDLDRFHASLDELLAAGDDQGIAAAVRRLPPPIALTPPERRREEPLVISTPMNAVSLTGRWQVGHETRIESGMGAVTVDLSDAELDATEVSLFVKTGMGTVTVIVPRGFDVRLTGTNGPVQSLVEPPIPGFPLVRLTLNSAMGVIRVIHPSRGAPPRPRRRLGRRRS